MEEDYWRRLAADPFNFLQEASTLDEHAKDDEPAIKPFPLCATCAKDDEANQAMDCFGAPEARVAVCHAHGRKHKTYVRPLVLAWLHSHGQTLAIEKSRQVLISWLFVILHLWRAMSREGTLIGFQSSNQDKSAELLTRAEIVYRSLPRPAQRFGAMSDAPKAKARKIEHEISFPENRSRVLALPSTAHHVRMYTFTDLMMDECQSWEPDEDFEDSYGAALATIKGGPGCLTAISSVVGATKYHYRLCHGLV